jgi:hypothetical protein
MHTRLASFRYLPDMVEQHLSLDSTGSQALELQQETEFDQLVLHVPSRSHQHAFHPRRGLLSCLSKL